MTIAYFFSNFYFPDFRSSTILQLSCSCKLSKKIPNLPCGSFGEQAAQAHQTKLKTRKSAQNIVEERFKTITTKNHFFKVKI